MEITVPDPHPGRCKNYRGGERCLDYDGHDSACRFPDPMPENRPYTAGSVYVLGQPKPWVSPLEDRP